MRLDCILWVGQGFKAVAEWTRGSENEGRETRQKLVLYILHQVKNEACEWKKGDRRWRGQG